eukprot:8431264-Alexandrium_andersonii.AAC.1
MAGAPDAPAAELEVPSSARPGPAGGALPTPTHCRIAAALQEAGATVVPCLAGSTESAATVE